MGHGALLQADVLVCAKSGGLLRERMRLVADLWAAGIRAEMMMTAAPSLTYQYEHANGRHIPWLGIMEASKLSASDTVKVSSAGWAGSDTIQVSCAGQPLTPSR